MSSPLPYQQKAISEMRCQKPIDHKDMINLIYLKDCFAQLHKHRHSNLMERKDTMADACTIQPPRHTNLEHIEIIM